MKKIVFVLSSKITQERVLSTWNLHGGHYAHTDMDNGDFEMFVDSGTFPDDFTDKKYEADALVSRGAIAQGLKAGNAELPVIEIPITTGDILTGAEKARQRFGPLKIGIVGTKNMLGAAEHLLNKKAHAIETYEYCHNTLDVIKATVNRALRDGSGIILCGIKTMNYCMENTIPSGHIDPSMESIWQAITEAKRAARIFHEERKRAMQFKAIVDYAQEGIIAVDNMKRFSLINQQAANILNIDGVGAIGWHTDQYLRNSKLGQCFSSSREYTNHLVNDAACTVSLTKKRLVFNDVCIGEVATFQDVTSILDAESRIRAKIHKRGHLAKHTFEDILGKSEAMHQAIDLAKTYARAESSVLLLGKTGTGKELFAQSIHNASSRAKGPFVAINCAALPESLLESELFGYVDGAFTGASKGGKIGLFELAHQGTLFLDELCELPLKLQGRLLRAIQEKEIMRLGDDRVIPVDVRILCASNKLLDTLVDCGQFREDLYYRLNVLCVSIPPLSQRGNDCLLLMRYYLEKHAAPRPAPRLGKEAEELLLLYEWKGNVRELRNLCERLVALDQAGTISRAAIVQALSPVLLAKALEPVPDGALKAESSTLHGKKQNFEKERIDQALQEAMYNKSAAAALLGISRGTLWRKLRQLG